MAFIKPHTRARTYRLSYICSRRFYRQIIVSTGVSFLTCYVVARRTNALRLNFVNRERGTVVFTPRLPCKTNHNSKQRGHSLWISRVHLASGRYFLLPPYFSVYLDERSNIGGQVDGALRVSATVRVADLPIAVVRLRREDHELFHRRRRSGHEY